MKIITSFSKTGTRMVSLNAKLTGFFLSLLVLVLLPFVSATDYEINKSMDIRFACILNETLCQTANCYVSSLYPNSTVFFINQSTTYSEGLYNYTANKTLTVGEYKGFIYCVQGSNSGYEEFTFNVVNKYPISTLTCPTRAGDIAGYIIVTCIVFFLILISFLFRMGLLGFFASFGVMFLGYSLTGCSDVLGLIIMLSGIILLLGFALWRWK